MANQRLVLRHTQHEIYPHHLGDRTVPHPCVLNKKAIALHSKNRLSAAQPMHLKHAECLHCRVLASHYRAPPMTSSSNSVDAVQVLLHRPRALKLWCA
eukprot:scaffold226940_cov33-Tisochrysis_lutea.AAC.2